MRLHSVPVLLWAAAPFVGAALFLRFALVPVCGDATTVPEWLRDHGRRLTLVEPLEGRDWSAIQNDQLCQLLHRRYLADRAVSPRSAVIKSVVEVGEVLILEASVWDGIERAGTAYYGVSSRDLRQLWLYETTSQYHEIRTWPIELSFTPRDCGWPHEGRRRRAQVMRVAGDSGLLSPLESGDDSERCRRAVDAATDAITHIIASTALFGDGESRRSWANALWSVFEMRGSDTTVVEVEMRIHSDLGLTTEQLPGLVTVVILNEVFEAVWVGITPTLRAAR